MPQPPSSSTSSTSSFMHTFPRNHPPPQNLRTTASGIDQSSPVRCCPTSTHNTQRRKTVTFLESIECPAKHGISASAAASGTTSSETNHLHHQHGRQHQEVVDDFPLPPPPLSIHQNSDCSATTNSDSSSVLTSPNSHSGNDASDYVESRV